MDGVHAAVHKLISCKVSRLQQLFDLQQLLGVVNRIVTYKPLLGCDEHLIPLQSEFLRQCPQNKADNSLRPVAAVLMARINVVDPS